MINALSSFKNINTIIIKAGPCLGNDFDRIIETTKQRLIALAPSKERRYIRVWHESNDSEFKDGFRQRRCNNDINAFVRGYYSEVPI